MNNTTRAALVIALLAIGGAVVFWMLNNGTKSLHTELVFDKDSKKEALLRGPITALDGDLKKSTPPRSLLADFSCDEGSPPATCLIAQGLASVKPEYVQNTADAKILRHFAYQTGAFGTAAQIEQLQKIVDTVEATRKLDRIGQETIPEMRMALFLGLGKIDAAVEQLLILQKVDPAYLDGMFPHKRGVRLLLSRNDLPAIKSFIQKTQRIFFRQPYGTKGDKRPVALPVMASFLNDNRVEEAIDFLNSLTHQNVFSLGGDFTKSTCDRYLMQYAYRHPGKITTPLHHSCCQMRQQKIQEQYAQTPTAHDIAGQMREDGEVNEASIAATEKYVLMQSMHRSHIANGCLYAHADLRQTFPQGKNFDLGEKQDVLDIAAAGDDFLADIDYQSDIPAKRYANIARICVEMKLYACAERALNLHLWHFNRQSGGTGRLLLNGEHQVAIMAAHDLYTAQGRPEDFANYKKYFNMELRDAFDRRMLDNSLEMGSIVFYTRTDEAERLATAQKALAQQKAAKEKQFADMRAIAAGDDPYVQLKIYLHNAPAWMPLRDEALKATRDGKAGDRALFALLVRQATTSWLDSLSTRHRVSTEMLPLRAIQAVFGSLSTGFETAAYDALVNGFNENVPFVE